MLFYFSGTGNSKWIATQLSFRLQERLYFIPDLLRKQTFDFILNNDERIGFVFPVYSWSLPDIVSSFIKKLSLQNYRCQYCFFVCSCGDDIGLTKNIFIKMMASKGWRCHAGFSVIMPNNYVLLPGFDVDDKSLAQKKLVNAIGKLDKIVATLHSQSCVFDCKKGCFPFTKTMLINPLFNRFHMSPKNFWTTGECVGCSRCIKICPMNNIVLENGKPKWDNNCAACLACYHICPWHAVQYAKRTNGKGQYVNPNLY